LLRLNNLKARKALYTPHFVSDGSKYKDTPSGKLDDDSEGDESNMEDAAQA
jgi:hypothetical protein